MFTPEQYRAKAAEYRELLKTATAPDELHEFRKLEQSFTTLADNEQWLADNYANTMHAPEHARTAGAALAEEEDAPRCLGAASLALAEEEDHVLRCLGAALIMQWNTLPTKLRRELFNNAGSMGAVLETVALRGRIARFLHKHKDDEDEICGSRNQQ